MKKTNQEYWSNFFEATEQPKTPKTNYQELCDSFKTYNIDSLEILQEDIFNWETDRKFNVVMSFGFVEHFSDLNEIMKYHWELVAEGEYMIISVPIFGPLQMLLRRLILKKEKLNDILEAHNLKVMNVRTLKKEANKLPDAQKIFASHLRQMHTWFRAKDSYVRNDRAFLLYIWKIIGIIPEKLKWSQRLFSPTGMIIYKKVSSTK